MTRNASIALCAALAAVALARTPARGDPRLDYVLQCRGCHGPDGSGAPGAAPSFRGQLGRFLWVPGGRAYLVRVPGAAQSELDDARTAALLNWLLHEFSPEEIPPDFTPYGADEVGRERRNPLIDVQATRRELLQAIAAHESVSASGPPRAQ